MYSSMINLIFYDLKDFFWLFDRWFSARTVLVFFISTLLSTILYQRYKKEKRLPPGPWGLPIVGYLPWIKDHHKQTMHFADKYGKVFSIRMGAQLNVYISCPDLLRTLFNRHDSIDRPKTPLNGIMEGLGIVLSEGLLWRRNRSFLHGTFRSLGVKSMSDARFAPLIMAEVEDCLNSLQVTAEAPVDPSSIVGRNIHNVICQLMMSFRFQENDPQVQLFNEVVSRGMKLYGLVNIGEYLPWLMKLPSKKKILDEIKSNLNNVRQFHRHMIDKHRTQREHVMHSPVDILDYYLDELDVKGATKYFPGTDPEKQIVQVMNDLFSAGMETSRNAIIWSLVMMLREPEVLQKVKLELSNFVQPGSLVPLSLVDKLGYLEAVIFETIRIVSVVPLGTIHVNSREWVANGHIIPAGSHVYPMIQKINMDVDWFASPERFMPERFIVSGKFQPPASFIPFGVGRRVCLGETLARMECFLFFANIVNNFDICLSNNEKMPNLEGVKGTTHCPNPFKMVFKRI